MHLGVISTERVLWPQERKWPIQRGRREKRSKVSFPRRRAGTEAGVSSEVSRQDRAACSHGCKASKKKHQQEAPTLKSSLWFAHISSNDIEILDHCLLETHHRASVQFSRSVMFPTLCDPMNCSTPGLPVHHHLPEFTQTHVHRVSDAIQPSHPLLSPSPPALNPSQHQNLFQ